MVRHCTAKHGGFINWDGLTIAVGRELAGRILVVSATGDHLLIFFRHHLIRDLILDRTRRYQGLPQPRRRDYNRDRLQAELQAHPKPTSAARQRGQPPILPSRRCPGAAQRLPSQGRPQAVAPRSRPATLESGGAAPLHSARRHTTTHPLSPMS